MNRSRALYSSARTLILMGFVTVSASACTSFVESPSVKAVPALIEGACDCEASTLWPSSDSIHKRLRVYDTLSIDVEGHEELNVSQASRPVDGLFPLPRVGDIDVRDKTVVEVKNAITEKLQRIIRDPIVTVSVYFAGCEAFHRVRVTGAVQKPISSRFCEGETVRSSIRKAGDVTRFAELREARLYRLDGNVLRIRLDHILEGSDMTTNYVIRRGDTLTVPTRPSTDRK